MLHDPNLGYLPLPISGHSDGHPVVETGGWSPFMRVLKQASGTSNITPWVVIRYRQALKR